MIIMETVSQIKMSFHIKMELFKMIPWYLIRSRYCLSFVSTCIHPRFLCGSVLLIVLDFLCCPVVCLCVLGSCCDFRMEAMFGFVFVIQLFVRGTLFLLGFSSSYVPYVIMLPVSLDCFFDCPFGIF